MGEASSTLSRGNTLVSGDIKFGRAADVLGEQKAKDIQRALIEVREMFYDSSEESKEILVRDMKNNFFVTRLTRRAHNEKTVIIGQPASVNYERQRLLTNNGELGGTPHVYRHKEKLGSVLSVAFRPGDERPDPEVFEFDFDVKDPVEEVVRLGQRVSYGGGHLSIHEGADLAMQVIIEAAEAVA